MANLSMTYVIIISDYPRPTEYAAVKLIDHVSKQMESGNIPCTLYIDL